MTLSKLGSHVRHAVQEKHERIAELKRSISIVSLCWALPIEFASCLTYARQLHFDQMPDYEGLRAMFRALATRLGIEYDGQFDWNKMVRLPSPSMQFALPSSHTTVVLLRTTHAVMYLFFCATPLVRTASQVFYLKPCDQQRHCVDSRVWDTSFSCGEERSRHKATREQPASCHCFHVFLPICVCTSAAIGSRAILQRGGCPRARRSRPGVLASAGPARAQRRTAYRPASF